MTTPLLKDIAATLITRKNSTAELNISQGLSGIALFLFLYSHSSNDEFFYNEAFEILDNIHTQLSDPSKVMQEGKLPDLGWLILHLVQKDLIEIDAAEIFQRIDTQLYNRCVYNNFRQLTDGQLIKMAMYFYRRHSLATDRHSRIKTEEALVHIVDGIRKLYGSTIQTSLAEINREKVPGTDTCLMIRTACIICLLFCRIYTLGISKYFISRILSEISKDLQHAVLENEHFSTGLKNDIHLHSVYSLTLLAISKASTLIRISSAIEDVSDITSKHCPEIYTSAPTCFVHSLITTVTAIQQLNQHGHYLSDITLLRTKLEMSVKQSCPGYPDNPPGLPNLGIREGLSGAGLVLLTNHNMPIAEKEEIMILSAH
jgi:hypothetical protein